MNGLRLDAAMTPAEMELELAQLRDALAQISAQDEARRKRVQQVGYINLAVALGFLILGLVLYLNNVADHTAFSLSAIVLICLASSMMALAERTRTRRGQ